MTGHGDENALISKTTIYDWAPIVPRRRTIGREGHHVQTNPPPQYFNNRQVMVHDQREGERSTDDGSQMGVISKGKRVY